MAEEKIREKKIVNAVMREQLGPELNRRGGKGDKPEKVREQPLRHEIVAGQVYAVERFPTTVDGVEPPAYNARGQRIYWGCSEYWESARAQLKTLYPEPILRHIPWEVYWNTGWKVRVVTAPTKGSKICLVERVSDGKLGVVDITALRFAWVQKHLF